MNPFVNRFSGTNAWILPVSLMALVLGVMINMAWITNTNRSDRIKYLSSAQGDRIRSGSIDLLDEYRKVSEEVTRLRGQKTELENSMGNQTQQTQLLNQNLQESKMLAGLTPVVGPGIKITLTDGKPTAEIIGADAIVHDSDVLKVVNELWAAGAEAISVNDHRIVSRSSFRCVGPVIHIDNVPTASPVIVKAIGDPDALFGGLNLPLGVLDEIRQTDPNMVKMEKLKSIMVPAYTGSTATKFAKPVTEKNASQQDGESE